MMPNPDHKTSPVDVIVNKERMTVECAQPLTVFVHQQGIRLDVPDFIEINSRDTIDRMAKMDQREWVHISTGPLFNHFFRIVFPPEDGDIEIPDKIDDLNSGDYGVIHVAGMIVMAVEAIFKGNGTKLFFRTPEDHMHPKAQRHLADFVLEFGKINDGRP